MLTLLMTLAAAHHPGGVSRVSNDNADVLAVQASQGEWRLDVGIGMVTTPFDHVQRGGRRGESVDGVVLLTHTLTARVWLPSSTFVQLSTPFTAVFTAGENSFGIGDVGAQVGQQVDLGPGVLTTGFGVSAPTGLASNKAGVEVLWLETEDGELYASSVQTRTQPGLGVWSAEGAVSVSQPVGRWRLRLGIQTRIPLGETDQKVRWGTDVALTSSVSTDVQMWRFGLGAEVWTHTPDRMPSVAGAVDPGDYRMNRSHGVAVLPTVGVAPSSNSRCGGAVQLPVWQWVDGSQLAPSYRVSAQCQVSVGRSGE